MIVLAICWRLSAFQSPSHEKSIFLKIRSFFSFKFFQGRNWLTCYPDSQFHGHWKTVTLSPISPNLSKHWRFLAFWLSLCFGSFLLFLVCHDTAFLFSTRAMSNECIRKSGKCGHCTRAEQECCVAERFLRKKAGNSRISTQTSKGRGTITTWHLLRSPNFFC